MANGREHLVTGGRATVVARGQTQQAGTDDDDVTHENGSLVTLEEVNKEAPLRLG